MSIRDFYQKHKHLTNPKRLNCISRDVFVKKTNCLLFLLWFISSCFTYTPPPPTSLIQNRFSSSVLDVLSLLCPLQYHFTLRGRSHRRFLHLKHVMQGCRINKKTAKSRGAFCKCSFNLSIVFLEILVKVLQNAQGASTTIKHACLAHVYIEKQCKKQSVVECKNCVNGS